MAGKDIRKGLVGLAVAWTAMAVCAVPAQAEEAGYLFNPVLSLTGDCSSSSSTPEDEVPDPAEPECPSPEGAHPNSPFSRPPVATDPHGDIFVANNSANDRAIDIFSPEGFFVSEITEAEGLKETLLDDLAVDGEGNLYVYGFKGEPVVLRFDPEKYEPAKGEITYKPPVTVLSQADGLALEANSIALDSEGRLYVDMGVFLHSINVYGPASEGNELLESEIAAKTLNRSKWVSVDPVNGNIYASGREKIGSDEFGPSLIWVFGCVPPEPGEEKLCKEWPLIRKVTGFFGSTGPLTVAIDEKTEQVLVSDLEVKRQVYVLPKSSEDQVVNGETPVIRHQFQDAFARIWVDNSTESPNEGYLFVPSMSKKLPPDHVYAFEPPPPLVGPKVESVGVSEITETEGELEAEIVPGNPEASYRFEYITDEAFEANGSSFEGVEAAMVFAEGQIPAGSQPVAVSAPLAGLEAGTTYHVRAVAENECKPGGCADEAQTTFTTYAPPPPGASCPNEALRTGLSSLLPDCRAYELVTPPETGGRPPETIGISVGDLFATPSATLDGESVSFAVGGGGIPGMGGAGSLYADAYLSERFPSGWRTRLGGPTSTQMSKPSAGGLSSDHGFSAWTTGQPEFGSLYLGVETHYIRYPDGSFRLIGRGSIEGHETTDLRASVKAITPGGGHIIFETSHKGGAEPVQLEPQAPPDGTGAIYDRTIDPLTGAEETHVISLLPNDETPAEGENATYQGSSADGNAVAFKLGSTATSLLYLRLDNEETLQATAEPGAEFAGLSEDGRYLFYVLEGSLYRFDSQTKATKAITESGNALFVNVSADGSHAYFVSPSVLTGEEENSQGAKAIAGDENLYVWDGVDTRFIGTVTKRDVEGRIAAGINIPVDGLGLWASATQSRRIAIDPSRTTPDGTVFLFESRAKVTAYDSGGKAEVYRYDASGGDLRCLSCTPTGSAATGDAALMSVGATESDAPAKTYTWIPNLSPDGNRAFFESTEALVMRDTNGVQDVYEWEEVGVGSCPEGEAGGCVFLISSGHSSHPSYLFGSSASGDDVFVWTTDRLTGSDGDETPSIYDARVEGGFAEPQREACEGETCHPPLTPPPPMPPTEAGRSGNIEEPRCPKGKHLVKRHGRLRCVKKHRRHRHHHHRRAGSK